MATITLPRTGRRRTTLVRILRCLAVSVGTTVLSATILVALTLGTRIPAAAANVIAVCCGIPVSYLANRRWVWKRRGGSTAREVVPFWAMSLAGLVASTFLVARVAAATTTLPPAWRAVLLPVANLAAFGLLWIAQFVVLDRVIFASDPARPTTPRLEELR